MTAQDTPVQFENLPADLPVFIARTGHRFWRERQEERHG